MNKTSAGEYELALSRKDSQRRKNVARGLNLPQDQQAPELDLCSFARSLKQSFRNHELLNSIMIREDAAVQKLQLTPDYSRIIYLTSRFVKIRELGDMLVAKTDLVENGVRYTSIAASPDGVRVAIACTVTDGSTEVHIYNMDEAIFEHPIRGFEGGSTITDLTYSRDGEMIACGCSDGKVLLLRSQVSEVGEEHILGALEGHVGNVTSVVFLCN